MCEYVDAYIVKRPDLGLLSGGLYLFIYGSFSDVISSSDCIVSNDWITDKGWNGKYFDGSGRDLIEILYKNLPGDIKENWIRKHGDHAKIRIEHLLPPPQF